MMRKLWVKGLSLVMASAMCISAGMALAADDAPAETKDAAVAAPQAEAGEDPPTADTPSNDPKEKPETKTKAEGGELDLTILHVNDTHAREGESDVDFAKIAGQAKKLKEQGQAVLLLDAGDTLHGRPIANLFEGYSIVKIYNTMGVDATVPGNHDFNYGWQRLLQLSAYANFPFLSANTVYSDGREPLLSSYIIREFQGYRVGIFGLSTPETVYKSHPDNTNGLEFIDPVKMAKQMTAFLQNNDCDYIIALGHIGLDEGTLVTSEDVCNAVPGIDLFIDGHSHTKLEEGLQTKNGLIVQANEYAKFAGVVNVTVTPEGQKTAKASLVDADGAKDWPEDAATKQIIASYAAQVDKETKIVIGKTDVELIGERDVVRRGDSNLGRLMVDAMRAATGTDIALNNGGNVRTTIAAGDITYADLLEVMPFGNIVVTKTVTGQDIISALEQGVSEYPGAAGGFLHISGGSYRFDPAKPVGQRVVEVKIGDEKIDPKKTYTLTTNDFLAAGGDDSPLGNGSITSNGDPMDAVVRDYIKAGDFQIDAQSRVTVVGGALDIPAEPAAETPAPENTDSRGEEAAPADAAASTEAAEETKAA